MINVLRFFVMPRFLALDTVGIGRLEKARQALAKMEQNTADVEKNYSARRMWLSTAQPFAHARKLASIRRVTPENTHYGYWVPADSVYPAECAGVTDKATITTGYVASHDGHHSGGGLWLGNTAKRVSEVLAGRKELPIGDALMRFERDLARLEAGEVDEIFFDDPSDERSYALHRVDPIYMQYLHKLSDLGHTTRSWSTNPLHADENAGYRHYRPTLLGDVIVVLGDKIEEHLTPESVPTSFRALR